jgi:hypothetical protein
MGKAKRPAYALRLLLEGRPLLFVTADALLVVGAILYTLVGGAEPRTLYWWVVLAPMLALGTPILSEVMALEQRAGTEAWVLTMVPTWRYLLRRVGLVQALLAAQGCLILGVFWAMRPNALPLVASLLQVAVVALLMGLVALAWALAWRGDSGLTWISTLATLLLLSPWLLRNPIPEDAAPAGWWLLPKEADLSGWAWNGCVLLAAALLGAACARGAVAAAGGRT